MTMIGYDNAVSRATLSAGSAEPALPVTNLSDDQGAAASGWQTRAGVLTGAAGAWFAGQLTAQQSIRVVSVHRTNLTPSATWRVRLGTAAACVEAVPALAAAFGVDAPDLPAGWTVTRTGSAWRFNSELTLTEYAADTACYAAFDPATGSALGLLIEPGRTNGVRNPRAEGAVAGSPGTLPTNWTSALVSGVSQTVVGSGTEDGIPYLDVRFSGTPGASGNTNLFFDTNTAIAAAAGDVFTGSLFWRLTAGALTNVAAPGLMLTPYDSGPASLTTSINSPAAPTSAALRTQRITTTYTMPASTASVRASLRFTVTSGQAIDFTVRIGAPQVEKGGFATTPILPAVASPAATTRGQETHTASTTGRLRGSVYAQAKVISTDASTSVRAIAFRSTSGDDETALRLRQVSSVARADAGYKVATTDTYLGAYDVGTSEFRIAVRFGDSLARIDTSAGAAVSDGAQAAPADSLRTLSITAGPEATGVSLSLLDVRVYGGLVTVGQNQQLSVDGTSLDASGIAYDSGTISANVVAGCAQAVHVLSSAINAAAWRVDLNDTTNPDGFINAALAYVGDVYAPVNGQGFRSQWVPQDAAETFETRGGQRIEQPLFIRRAWQFELGTVRRADAWSTILQLDRAARERRNILYIPAETAEEINAQTVFGIMRPDGMGYAGTSGQVMVFRGQVIERL